MIKEQRTLKIRRIKSRRLQERRLIDLPFNSEEWVKSLEINKEYVLWPAIDRRLTDRRCDDRRLMGRRLAKHNFQNNTVLIKAEIDYLFNLFSKSRKRKATVEH